MAEPLQNPDDCPIHEDLRFQQVMWVVERLGWVLMTGVVVAAMAGLFGGPTAQREARDGSGRLLVAYQHLQRHLDPTAMRFTIDTRGQSLFELTIDKTLAQAFEIRSVSPQPIETQAHDGGLLMKFGANAESREPAEVTVIGIPNHPGPVAGDIGLLGESPAHLEIFVYP